LTVRGGRVRTAGLLAAAAALAAVTGARAEDPIGAGVKDVGLGGAISISHGTLDGFDTITGFVVLPHVSFVLSEVMGAG
jgi:hypothetical protein